ncbi:MAG: deoxynucleoside kinase [Burkholderiaceae bacterium]|nr:MAG: deoxynucleoside kinase [Burkholderiaceae bacterium]
MNKTPSLADRFRHIVVEGPIGAGKTTLARKLADYAFAPERGELMLEQAHLNPFLERFYLDSRRYALSTQLHFLFHRLEQLQEMEQHDFSKQPLVGDFLLEKDPLFAELTLADDELKLYQQVYARVQPEPQTPDLVIYLQAKPDILIARIHKRGLPMESAIAEAYLAQLSDRYTRFFHHYEGAPLLIVNAEHLNPIDNDADFALLLKQIEQMKGRREFFNRG